MTMSWAGALRYGGGAARPDLQRTQIGKRNLARAEFHDAGGNPDRRTTLPVPELPNTENRYSTDLFRHLAIRETGYAHPPAEHHFTTLRTAGG